MLWFTIFILLDSLFYHVFCTLVSKWCPFRQNYECTALYTYKKYRDSIFLENNDLIILSIPLGVKNIFRGSKSSQVSKWCPYFINMVSTETEWYMSVWEEEKTKCHLVIWERKKTKCHLIFSFRWITRKPESITKFLQSITNISTL